jgi:transcriptional regulator with XRE-family HTH domain
MSTTFGTLLRETREGQNLTRTELAKAAQVSKATVTRLEQGVRTPSLGMVRRLATALNIMPSTLLSTIDTEEVEDDLERNAG